MSAGLTNTGETRINQLLGNGGDLIIDRFVLANIAGLDPDTAIDKTMGMPDQAEIVHTYAIPENYKGYIDPNQVVYSMILGADVGDFTFNSLFLVEASTDNIIAVAKTGDQEKFATDLQVNKTGNTLTRNFMIGFQDAQTLTGITIEAESWQIDFSNDFNTHVNSLVDPTATGSEGKHVTDSQAKKWEDHADDDHDYAASVHTHDNRYYTETETDNLLSQKSDTGHTHDYAAPSHTHDSRYYTETETDNLLSQKSDTGHTHAYAPLASPALTGNPTAPTQTYSDRSTKLATTDFVRDVLDTYGYKGIVTRRSSRTSTGTWTITGLTVGKPFFVTSNNKMVYMITSGADLLSSVNFANADTKTSSFIAMATSSTVTISVSSHAGTSMFYQ